MSARMRSSSPYRLSVGTTRNSPVTKTRSCQGNSPQVSFERSRQAKAATTRMAATAAATPIWSPARIATMNNAQAAAATVNSTRSPIGAWGGGSYLSAPRSPRRQKKIHRHSIVTAIAVACGAHMRAAKSRVDSSTRPMASRLVRLETGRSRLAVLASQIVVIARGSGAMRARGARASMTGVSSTAVVSKLRNIVTNDAKAVQRRNSAA